MPIIRVNEDDYDETGQPIIKCHKVWFNNLNIGILNLLIVTLEECNLATKSIN